jgi:ABC-type transport system involved in multi-copper enzyme maturation permease subunit
MSLWHALAAELRKTATLPAALVAVAVAALGSTGITLLNAFNVRSAVASGRPELVAYTSPVEAAFSAAPLGTVGAVILGVVAISSEYSANSSDAGGGRQITATLTAVPRRLAVLTAKAIGVVLLVAGTAAVTIAASLVLAYGVIGDVATSPADPGDTIARSLGVAAYWTLTGLIAMAITVLTRSGIAPLIVLIVNSSLVSVSLLLTKLTSLARYLPDLAGIRLFSRDLIAFDNPLGPLAGGLVMTAWTIVLLAIAATVLTRRDA